MRDHELLSRAAAGNCEARRGQDLACAGELRRGMNVRRHGWGCCCDARGGRGWFERAIERAPGDVATSVATGSPPSRDLELRSQPSSEAPIVHGHLASFLKPYGQRSVFLGKAWPKANVVVPPS